MKRLLCILSFGLFAACNTSPASDLALALDGIGIAATVLPAAIPNLSPQAASCIAAIPDLVTTIADVIQGSQPLTAASTAAAGLQTLLATQCAVSAIPVKDQPLVNGIAAAITKFLTAFQSLVAKYASTPEIEAANLSRYSQAFTGPTPATSKYKASGADKKKAKDAAARAAKIKAAMAAAKGGGK
jgi:hypothetical protein